jgi:hypothetical protein
VTAKDKAEDTGDPLDDYSPYEWMGPARNVFCVDYAVGGRYVERARRHRAIQVPIGRHALAGAGVGVRRR